MTMTATRALVKTKPDRSFTSMWCFGPNDERLALRGHGPGLTFEYEHVEGCSRDPKGMPDCKPSVVVAGLRTKHSVIRHLRKSERPTLCPGDSVVFS